MTESLRDRLSNHDLAKERAAKLKADQEVTMVWSRLDGDGTEYVIAERRDGRAERHSIHPDGMTIKSFGKIDHSRADRGHVTRLTRFIPDELIQESTELDRREF